MLPNYPHGKVIFAWRFSKPRQGDVVIVKHHQVELIKRVDKIDQDRVFLLGDNPEESTDSRHYGWLPLSAIRGVVLGGNNG
ncbi:MAG TPA: S26 family signal peptidase [Candidatus Saccharimonadales bacterium]|nr:S26 family signal peptidase [Candidatus Saccharimonadales bacterium]